MVSVGLIGARGGRRLEAEVLAMWAWVRRVFGKGRREEAADLSEFAAMLDWKPPPREAAAERAAQIERLKQRLAVEALRRPGCVSGGPEATVAALIGEIDAALSAQMNAILSHPEMRALERAWRGLARLARQIPRGGIVALKVLDVPCPQALPDGPEGWDALPLKARLHDEVYARPGAAPFAVLVVDCAFDHSDVPRLSALARIGALCQMPVLAEAAISLLGDEGRLPLAGALEQTCDGPAHTAWRALRARGESRYLCLCLPGLRARLPWGDATAPVGAFRFTEESPGCWTNPALAMAANIARSVARTGWATDIRGVESGGAVEGLEAPVGVGPALASPMSMEVDERQESHLARLGLTALVRRKGTSLLCFMGAQSLAADPAGGEDTPGERLLTRLPYLLFATRYAQHVMRMAADAPEAEASEAFEARVRGWFAGQVRADIWAMTAEEMARHPLQAVEFHLDPGPPGTARLMLTPGHRLEGGAYPMQLNLTLPERARRQQTGSRQNM